jgi:hypothetical protein
MARSQNYYLRTFHGIILVGLGVLALTNYWWPGILFVFGIALLADAIIQRKVWRSYTTPIILLALGLLFHFNRLLDIQDAGFWPIILIILGLAIILFQRRS